MKYLWILFLLVGCSHVKPYGELGLSFQFDEYSDWYLQTDRTWQCDNPKFDLEVGIELHHGWQIGLHHESWLLCDSGDPETYSNDLRINKKWGGW